MFDPGTIVSAVAPTVIGGLMGGSSSGPAAPQLTPAPKVGAFTSGLGSAGPNQFTYTPNANVQAATDMARQQLLGQLGKGLTYDPTQAAQYTQAYLGARQPALEQQLQQQTQQQQAGLGATGMAGSSGAAYQQALQQQMANQARTELQNQAVLGGQQLAVQDLQNKLASAGALQGLSQQDIQNQLAAMQAMVGAQQGAQAQETARAGGNAQMALNQWQAANQANQQNLSNIFGGALVGQQIGSKIGGGIGDIFSKGMNTLWGV